MKFQNLFSAMKRKVSDNSPSIAVGVGVAGIIPTAALASKATLKAKDVLKEHKEAMAILEEAKEAHLEAVEKNAVDSPAYEYGEKEYRLAKVSIYAKTTWSFVKLYAPAILSGVASAALIIGSHVVMRNRLTSAIDASIVLSQMFSAYKNTIEEKFGKEDVEKALKAATKSDTEDFDERVLDRTSRLFAEGKTSRWTRDPVYNTMLLSQKQNYFNDLLQHRGYVFFNEVLTELGFECVPYGQRMGWLRSDYYDANSVGYGDGFIDFGIFETENVQERMRGEVANKDSILLDFNIDHKLIDREI